MAGAGRVPGATATSTIEYVVDPIESFSGWTAETHCTSTAASDLAICSEKVSIGAAQKGHAARVLVTATRAEASRAKPATDRPPQARAVSARRRENPTLLALGVESDGANVVRRAVMEDLEKRRGPRGGGNLACRSDDPSQADGACVKYTASPRVTNRKPTPGSQFDWLPAQAEDSGAPLAPREPLSRQ